MDKKASKSKSRSKSKPKQNNKLIKKSPNHYKQPKQVERKSHHSPSGTESPKTIDYSKLIEKYGKVINNNDSPKFNNRNLKNNRTPSRDKDYSEPSSTISRHHTKSMTNLASKENTAENTLRERDLRDLTDRTEGHSHPHTPKHTRSHSQNNKLLRQELQLAQEKIAELEQEKIRGEQLFLNRDIVGLDNYEIITLKRRLAHVEKENKELKKNSTKVLNEKVAIMLKLFRKYSKKLSQLAPLLEGNLISSLSSELFNDLKETIDQFNNTVNNTKLYSMFNIQVVPNKLLSNITADNHDIAYDPERIDLSEFKPQQNKNLLKIYENKLKKLQEENTALSLNIKEIEEKEKEKTDKLKLKIETIQQENNDVKANNSYLKNLNKELQTKIQLLSSNESKYQFQCDTITKLKDQVASLENDIKYKETTIASFEKKISYNNNNNNNYNQPGKCSNDFFNFDSNSNQNMMFNHNRNNSNKDSVSSSFPMNHKYTSSNVFNSDKRDYLPSNSNGTFDPNKHQNLNMNHHDYETYKSSNNYNEEREKDKEIIEENSNEIPSQLQYCQVQQDYNKSTDDHRSNDYEDSRSANNNNEQMSNDYSLKNQQMQSEQYHFKNYDDNIPQEKNDEQPEYLQSEIDALDKEICSLKSKLKHMITTTTTNI